LKIYSFWKNDAHPFFICQKCEVLNLLNQFAREYWYEEMARHGFTVINNETSLSDVRLIAAPGLNISLFDHLSAEEWREASRACKGSGLRSEVFAYDATSAGDNP
jgi:hypothetical protein